MRTYADTSFLVKRSCPRRRARGKLLPNTGAWTVQAFFICPCTPWKWRTPFGSARFTQGAFDRQGSQFTYRTYFQATGDDLYLRKSEGWGQTQTRKILPGIDLNYAPVVDVDTNPLCCYSSFSLPSPPSCHGTLLTSEIRPRSAAA